MGTLRNRNGIATASERPLNRLRKETTGTQARLESSSASLLTLRFDVKEAARILRMSRAQLYNRLKEGRIKAHKDGARTYITRAEIERYVAECSNENAVAM